jgi:hypothetical protein
VWCINIKKKGNKKKKGRGRKRQNIPVVLLASAAELALENSVARFTFFTGLPSTGMTEAIDKRTDDTSNDDIDG